MIDAQLIYLAVSGIATVLWYLLRKRDEEQQQAIDLLFKKHDADAEALTKLKLEIASHHYVKSELDAKFDRLQDTFTNGFETLGNKFDKLSDALVEHIAAEATRNGH